jgi:NADPH-dependent glutamate synthase beta subunit-like oxidoreductase
MIQLKIDHIEISAPEGTSVLETAKAAGISIPVMCYKEGYHNHPSCMICLVKDRKTGNLFPSCAIKVAEGMDLISNDEELREARKDALDLLLSDHVGDCEAPCTLACPANMNIPGMNRLIAEHDFAGSLKIVKEEIALPFILGYICPAPCEKACRRKQIDNPVSVCLLKRFVAAEDENARTTFLARKEPGSGKKVAIIGTGPAGLASAYYLLQKGHRCVLFDKNEEAGGAMRYSIPEEELPRSALESELQLLLEFGAEFRLGTRITKELFVTAVKQDFDAIIIATGDIAAYGDLKSEFQISKTGISIREGTYETSEEGIFACGSVLRAQKMAVRAVAQGKAAALSADMYLKGITPVRSERKFNSRFDKLSEPEFAEYLKESVPGDRISPAGGIKTGFSKDEAISEATRCMHCDCRKMDECKLRDYSDEYRADRRKYATGERKMITKYFEHERIVYEPEKCIRCGLCIDITVKSGEGTGLAFIGRGFDVRVEVPFSKPMSQALTHSAQECSDSCPTGALSFKHK